MPETTQGQHFLKQIRFLILLLIFVIVVFGVTFGIIANQGADNTQQNADNIEALEATVDHLTEIVVTTGDDARETRHSLEAALKRAQESNDPNFTNQIKAGLEAIKRIEAKLDAATN